MRRVTGPIGPLVSIVIPVLNEAGALPSLLDRLAELPGSFELIVVDGGSSDGTAAHALAHPARPRVIHGDRGRRSR